LGSLTAFYGGVVAIGQNDIKRILAYSTISHCGFLMVLYSSGLTEYVILYLWTHGFFKSSVFLCVGDIIRFSNNNQNIRKMGGYAKFLPFTLFCIVISLLNLAGLPLFFGYLIKHSIIFSTSTLIGFFFGSFCIMACLTGCIYCFKIFYYVFYGFSRGSKNIYLNNESIYYSSIFANNSTIGGNAAITFLLLNATIILLYLSSMASMALPVRGINEVLYGPGYYKYVLYAVDSVLLNFWVVDVLIAICYVIVIYLPWQKTQARHNHLNELYTSVVFIFLVYFF